MESPDPKIWCFVGNCCIRYLWNIKVKQYETYVCKSYVKCTVLVFGRNVCQSNIKYTLLVFGRNSYVKHVEQLTSLFVLKFKWLLSWGWSTHLIVASRKQRQMDLYIYWVPGQPGLHCEITVKQNNYNKYPCGFKEWQKSVKTI